MKTKIDMVVDMQYGSTGKGAIAGYLATHRDYDTVITANTPNSGHTFIDIDGNVMIHKVLPNSVVGENVFKVLIGPGAGPCFPWLGCRKRWTSCSTLATTRSTSSSTTTP
jgi:hypothetical protein